MDRLRICVPVSVPVTALISPMTDCTTPPKRSTVVHRRPPNRPTVQVCGGELYWMMTLTEAEG